MSLRKTRSNPERMLAFGSPDMRYRNTMYMADWLRREGKADWVLWVSLPIALGAGVLLGMFSSFALVALAAFVGIVVLGYLFAVEQYALLALLIFRAGLFVDYFLLLPLPLNLPVVAAFLALLFLAACFFAHSAARPWIRVPHLGWWIGLLILTIPSAIRGGLLVGGGGSYYFQIFFDALLFYMIGVQVARDVSQVRRLFGILSGFATLIAIHSILQAETRSALYPTPHWDSYLASVNNFALAGSNEIRAGSFFINPDNNGTFLALMLFIPVSLFLESSSRRLKGLYVLETVLILLGLFFTYSLISIGALCVGAICFILLVGRGRFRFYALGLSGAVVLVIFIAFPSLLRLLLSHGGSAVQEFLQRAGAWITALRVILAYPLTGVGLGVDSYLNGSEPYRVPLETGTGWYHPHNSFLEIAARCGLPALIFFLVVFWKSGRRAFRNYRRSGKAQRTLLGGGITALTVMTVNSLASDSWTLPPLVLVGWLLLGALSSPMLIPPARSRDLLEKRLPGADRKVDELATLSGGVRT